MHGLESTARPSLLRRLDYVPAWLAIALGVGAGALLGMGLAMASPIVAGVGFVALLGCAVALAGSGEPITVLERTSEPAAEVEPARSSETVPEPEPAPAKLGMELVKIPAGTFQMGSPDDAKPVHEVRISAFECMRFPVTRRLYKEITGNDPGWPAGKADERPVNNVSWHDAVRFCNKLSGLEDLTPCYRIDAYGNVSWNRSADGYRLLTEAEWEYACRAGTRTRWSFGDDEQELDKYAWFKGNSNSEPHPVGQKEPNAWGLYDMHGNVWEWCWDWYGLYAAEPQTDPVGPPQGERRVRRGGAFAYEPWNLRSALRFRYRPEDRYFNLGFRCALGPRRQP